jgi:uncharacterized protein YukE
VSSVNWHDWSLADLKALVNDTHPQMLDDSIKHFNQSAQHLSATQDSFMSHMSGLGDAWQGKAATAAINNAQTTYQSMDDTRASSSTASTQTASYKTDLAHQQQQAKAVPNVDTSWGHAASSGGWAGPIGIGVAKMEQQKKYDQHRDQVATIVQKMDQGGEDHANTMKGVSWPPTNNSAASPPASLPPVPGASSGKSGPSTTSPSGGYHSSGNTTGGPGYTPAVMGPAMNPNDNNAINGPKGPHSSTGTTITQGGNSPTPDFPTVPQGGDGVPPVSAGTGPGGPVVASPPTTTTPGGAGAAAAVLGGAGLLGAGAAGSRGLLGGAGTRGVGGLAGEPEGRLGARGPGARSGGGGLGEGDGTAVRGGARGATGLGDGEGTGLRGGVRGVNGGPNEELGAGRNGTLRGAGSGGLAGEPVAAEAGRGGYPMGGSGARRRNDDEEAPVPDYLVETDDVWGDGASAAPPVIGE